MAGQSPYVSHVILCYHCHSVEIQLVRHWREVALGSQKDEFPVSFVSCTACQKLPGVHRPTTAYFRRYANPDDSEYADFIRSLNAFGRPIVQEQRKLLGFPSFTSKMFARVRDISEIVYTPAVPDEKIIICSGRNITSDCGFFGYQSRIVNRTMSIDPNTALASQMPRLCKAVASELQHLQAASACPEGPPKGGRPSYDSESSFVRYAILRCIVNNS